jgi:hypothetical protein
VTYHSQTLTGLTANTTYHYRGRSADATGNAAVSGDGTFTTAPPPPVLLVGDKNIESTVDHNPAGAAEAFQYTAGASGTVNKLSVYIDAGSTATQVVVGLYGTAASGNPGALLAQGTIANPINGAWNAVTIPAVTITSGTKYWIAVLGPSGTIQFRDKPAGGKSQTSAQANLATLPDTWTPGTAATNAPLSAYAAQSP